MSGCLERERWWGWAAWLLLLAGAACTEGSDGDGDATSDDMAADGWDNDARPGDDAGTEGGEGGCSSPSVSCGGECVDVSTNPVHCGECYRPCGTTGAFPSCTDGECELSCWPGWVDANGNPFDGCEYECTATGTAEDPAASCDNGLDDDCDGRTDDTDPDCEAGCVPEWCNGLDEDCDGLTDEDFDMDFDTSNCGGCGLACPPRPHGAPTCVLGICEVVCEPGWSDANASPADGCEEACTTPGSTPESICNGVDDDCDGRTDEDFEPTTTCGLGFCERSEICRRGGTICVARTAPASADTTCDGLDDDCDGMTDEEAACTCPGECTPDETRSCGECGTRTCSAGCTWGPCDDPGYVSCSTCSGDCRHDLTANPASCGTCAPDFCGSCAAAGSGYNVSAGCAPGDACHYEVHNPGYRWNCRCP